MINCIFADSKNEIRKDGFETVSIYHIIHFFYRAPSWTSNKRLHCDELLATNGSSGH